MHWVNQYKMLCSNLFSNPSLLHNHLKFKELESKPSFSYSWVFWWHLKHWAYLHNQLEPVLIILVQCSWFKSQIWIYAFFQYFSRLFFCFNQLIIPVQNLFSKINRLTLFLTDWKYIVQWFFHPNLVIQLIQLKIVFIF